MSSQYHNPVMLSECMQWLAIKPEGTYVDATFGGGGHSREILSYLSERGRLYAFDKDEDALANKIDDERFHLIKSDFRYLYNALRMEGVREIDGVLADLGVSSHQLDTAERGFSTRYDGDLDMRMNSTGGEKASDILAAIDEDELALLLRNYGQIPNHRAFARAIIAYRDSHSMLTTTDLRQSVARLLPHGKENKYLAMLFQALRIAVNDELEALKMLLSQSAQMLSTGGRIVVMSYHSLEDGIVKNFLRTGNIEGKVVKDDFGNNQSIMRLLTKGVVSASEQEVMTNSRARSARLRAGEKVEVITR